MENIIELKNISKTYGRADAIVQALFPINLEIKKGEMTAIMGKSGSGKSTLLNILGGIDHPDDGQYIFNNEVLNTKSQDKMARFRRVKIGFVVQNFALIDEYTVMQNIALPLKYNKCKKSLIKSKIKQITQKLDIVEKIKKYPRELSGGQMQRTAIARAVVHNPEVILADEPTGALDLQTGENIMQLFKEINKNGTTVIIVTHDANVASYCDKIINLQDGKIIKN